jgi:hypothetical protein
VDSESIIINSAGSITCGIFSILMILFLVGFPSKLIHKEIYPLLKEARPYKSEITGDFFSNMDDRDNLKQRESIFLPVIIKAADKHNVDPALVKAIIMAESRYNPLATSKKGAIGLMQIMPSTASALGIQDMYNPINNIEAGVEYLKKLMNQFEGDLEMTLAAYYSGSSKVMEYQGVPPYEKTINYVNKVVEYYKHYQGTLI